MIDSSIMSVREMIDVAFGEQDVNKVNFKIIQTVLYILARQLRILERQVDVNFGTNNIDSTSSISITELKLQAKVTKPKKLLKSNTKEIVKTSQDKKEKAETPMQLNIKSTKPSDKSEQPVFKYEEMKKKDLHQYIEDIEQQREQILRVVNQRANSREEPENPMPMAPLDSAEYLQYEKLLVVERKPKDDTSKGTQRLSIVTQQQFNELNQEVKELQKQFGAVGVGEFPENVKLMKDLRRGASLTDAMAALQLSARIDSAEKTLQYLLSLLKDLAIAKGIDVDENQMGADKQKAREASISETRPSESQWVSSADLDEAMQKIQDEIIDKVTTITGKTTSNAENALKIATNLEKGLSNALQLDNRMEALEDNVFEFADRVNVIDTSLSSQMTQYQEQLTQMQHDLESAMESMAEAIANSSGDPAAVAEFSKNLSNLQTDLDFTNTKQKELEHNQSLLSSALESLLQQIETLRDYKADREEVADALRYKAGIDKLNGLVTQEEFNAIRGDFEKRIKAAYNKFDSQELKWEQAIDDLQRTLDEKANITDVKRLRNDINEYLEILRDKLQTLMDIVGEPRAVAVSKILFRDTACISCKSPANMNMVVEPNLPLLPACSTPEQRKAKPKEDGDHGVCYVGLPIPHPIDPSKGRICHRYCGGSHTAMGSARNKLVAGITVCPAGARNVAQEVGTDGKVYKTEGTEKEKITCEPCNVDHTNELSKQYRQGVQENFMQEQSSFDFTPSFDNYDIRMNGVSITPPFTED